MFAPLCSALLCFACGLILLGLAVGTFSCNQKRADSDIASRLRCCWSAPRTAAWALARPPAPSTSGCSAASPSSRWRRPPLRPGSGGLAFEQPATSSKRGACDAQRALLSRRKLRLSVVRRRAKPSTLHTGRRDLRQGSSYSHGTVVRPTLTRPCLRRLS
jgi:hypothetical protein